MEEEWVVSRAHLRRLLVTHPEWTDGQYATATDRSLSWVKKWKRRFAEADPADTSVIYGYSRARHTPPESIAPPVVERILEIRDHPPAQLGRVPGPRTILYYLHQQTDLVEQGHYLPTSTSTIWGILDAHGRISRQPPRERIPEDRPPPLHTWQIDFVDVTTIDPEPYDKQQHWVEALNVVDMGTSLALESVVSDQFDAETALYALAMIFLVEGLPERVSLDRDPRFVGSWSGRGFPSALIRFLLCLGVNALILPPQRPDRNGFVERFNRTYKHEWLYQAQPRTLEEAQTGASDFLAFYNHERPNQALSCGNQPPTVAFPSLPALPRVPELVDPDAWLDHYDGRAFKRRIDASGRVQISKQRYYVKQAWRGRYVVLRLDAAQQQWVVELDGQAVKRLPLRGLHHRVMTFQAYLALIGDEARAEWRQYLRQRARQRRAA